MLTGILLKFASREQRAARGLSPTGVRDGGIGLAGDAKGEKHRRMG